MAYAQYFFSPVGQLAWPERNQRGRFRCDPGRSWSGVCGNLAHWHGSERRL